MQYDKKSDEKQKGGSLILNKVNNYRRRRDVFWVRSIVPEKVKNKFL